MNPYLDRNRTIGQFRWYGMGEAQEVPKNPLAELESASKTLVMFGVVVMLGILIWGMKK
jgi:hypothetical protein